ASRGRSRLGYRTASPPKLYPHVASSKLTQADHSESRTAVCVAFCALLILALTRPRSLRIIQALLVHSRLVIASWSRRGHRASRDSYFGRFRGKRTSASGCLTIALYEYTHPSSANEACRILAERPR